MRAVVAHTPEDLADKLNKSTVVDRPRQLDVAKVTGTLDLGYRKFRIRLPAGWLILTALACETLAFLLHGAHPRIVDGTEIGDPAVTVDADIVNLDDGHAGDLLRLEETELHGPNFVKLDIGLGLRLASCSTHFINYKVINSISLVCLPQ